MEHQITRIVMGHSRRTRWQELWQGSVVNSLLRRLRGVDLFLVADRAAREGERVVPAKVNDVESLTYRRLSEQEMKEQIGQIQRAEALAEGRGKAQADTLRKTKSDTMANLVQKDGTIRQVSEGSVLRSEPALLMLLAL